MGSMTPLEKPRSRCRKWRLTVSLGSDSNGKRIRKTKTVTGTAREAKRLLAEFEAYWGVGVAKEQTLQGYQDEWLRRKAGTVQDTSMTSLVQRANAINHLFGSEILLSELTPEIIDDAMLRLLHGGGISGKPCKASYVGSVQQQLASILRDAYRKHLIRDNPMYGTQYYSSKAEKRRIPTSSQVMAAFDALDPRDYRQMGLILVISLGLRRQEACALRWKDVDLENNLIHIRVTARWNGIKKHEEVVDATKTEAGRRDIPIPEHLKPLLEMRREKLQQDIDFAIMRGVLRKPPETLYVCANELGKRTSLTSITKWWCNHRDRFDLDCTVHDMRHHFVSALAAQGVHPSTAAALVGHGDVGTTLNVYTHVQQQQLEEAMREMDSVVAAKGEREKQLSLIEEQAREIERLKKEVASYRAEIPISRERWDKAHELQGKRKPRQEEAPEPEPEGMETGFNFEVKPVQIQFKRNQRGSS